MFLKTIGNWYFSFYERLYFKDPSFPAAWNSIFYLLFSVMVKNITVSNNCMDDKSVTVSWTINQTFPISVKHSIYIRSGRGQHPKTLNLSEVWLATFLGHHFWVIIFRLRNAPANTFCNDVNTHSDRKWKIK